MLHDLELGEVRHFVGDVHVLDRAHGVRKVLFHASQRSVVGFKRVSLEVTDVTGELADLVDSLIDDRKSSCCTCRSRDVKVIDRKTGLDTATELVGAHVSERQVSSSSGKESNLEGRILRDNLTHQRGTGSVTALGDVQAVTCRIGQCKTICTRSTTREEDALSTHTDCRSCVSSLNGSRCVCGRRDGAGCINEVDGPVGTRLSLSEDQLVRSVERSGDARLTRSRVDHRCDACT